MTEIVAERAESAASELFSPDVLLPEQFYELNKGSEMSGERALQWAVFADGIDSYRRLAQTHSRAGRRELAKLKVWITRSDWDWLYSFVNLCSTFGFDPNAVRQALARFDEATEQPTRRRRFRHAA